MRERERERERETEVEGHTRWEKERKIDRETG